MNNEDFGQLMELARRAVNALERIATAFEQDLPIGMNLDKQETNEAAPTPPPEPASKPANDDVISLDDLDNLLNEDMPATEAPAEKKKYDPSEPINLDDIPY